MGGESGSRRDTQASVKQKDSRCRKSLIFHSGMLRNEGASMLSCQGFIFGVCRFFLRAWTVAASSHRLTGGSMKKEGSELVTVEDFYRRCLQGTKPRLGQVASKRGLRAGKRRRRGGGRKAATLWDRLRER